MTTITVSRPRAEALSGRHGQLPGSWLAKIVIALLIVTGAVAVGDRSVVDGLVLDTPAAHAQVAQDRAHQRIDIRHRREMTHCLHTAHRLSLDPAGCLQHR